MPIQPNFKNNQPTQERRICNRCRKNLLLEDYAETRSLFFPGNHITLCNNCVADFLEANEYSWEAIDRICRWADIPFIVKEWTRIAELSPHPTTWKTYSKVFADQIYEGFDWNSYNTQYKRLAEVGLIEEEIPLVKENRILNLRKKWGGQYSEEQLQYLEDLYKGLLATQNVTGALQIDQAQKLCKLSLAIDERIQEGGRDVDKLLASYDKIIKTGEFTPRNAKNQVDFDSFSEVALWLEKRGNVNTFYDGVTRDVIDETLKNLQTYNQRLYVNEGGLGDEITSRLKALESAHRIEKETQYYDLPTSTEDELDKYANEAFDLDEEFDPDGE